MKSDVCPVCFSHNTICIRPQTLDIKRLSFTYEFSPESQKTFRVLRCKDCTHVFCSPLPKDLYKNYEDVVDKEYIRHFKTRELSAEAVLKTIKKIIPTGKILDVGCATGDFLRVAKTNGYEAEGLELSKWSSEIASKNGLKVYRNTLKVHANKFKDKYDIITLWGVIEHFEHPDKEMKYINTLLKPGGYVILWTGNVDGLMSQILKHKWWYWQGQHIQYFTQKSLNYLAQKNGFEHIVTKTYPIAATFEQMENSVSRYKRNKYIIPLFKLVFSIAPVLYLRFPGEMFWIARKKI